MAGIRSLFWNGLTRKASAPASRACSTTSRWLNAVRISTPQIFSPLMMRAASTPSMPGHLDVEDGEIGLKCPRELDRLVAAAGLTDDLVSLLLEGLAQVHADDGFVFGDHDAQWHPHYLPFAGGVGRLWCRR